MKVKIKRIYEDPNENDGKRILVDRLWPRGVSKDKAKIDLWVKDIAPSDELRKWFGHDPKKWIEFQKRYKKELEKNIDCVSRVRKELSDGPATLIYSAKDTSYNNAVVLSNYL
jgi:uncharacterized protein YeaO (DUF488 family)